MNKYKRLALNTMVFAIGSFGSKLLAFLLTRLYTANLDTSLFNTKEILEMCANLLIPVVSFSITDAIIRYGLDRNYERESVFSNAVTVLLAGSAIFLLLSPLLLLYADIRPYVLLLVGYVLISCFRQLSTQFARARNYVTLYAADGIACTLSLFIFNIIFIAWLKLGITGFMLSIMLSDLLSGLTVWLIANHSRFFSFRFIDRELLETMLRFSLPLIPTAILWIITGFSDRLFIRHIMTASDAGVYGAAAKIPNLISMVSTVFYQAWNMSAIAENGSAKRSAFYTQVYDAYQAMLALAAGFIIAFDQPLSNLLVVKTHDAAYARAYLYTPVLVIAVLLMCYNQFLSSVYTVSKHTKNSFYTSLVAAVLNLCLNGFLIAKNGVHGAIAATLASYLVCYLVRVVDTRRFIPFEVRHWRFVLNLIILFGMSAVIHRTDPALQNPFPTAAVVLLEGAGFLLLAAVNFTPLMMTVKKVLRR